MCDEAKVAAGTFCNDPWTAPARNPPVFEKNWNNLYSVKGMFVSPEEREKLNPGCVGCGGQQGSPDVPGNMESQYGVMMAVDVFGKVLHVTGKYIKTPKTWNNDPIADYSDAQLLYWSVTSSDFVTGQNSGGLSDEQIPELPDGTFSIVISKPEYRPKSAN